MATEMHPDMRLFIEALGELEIYFKLETPEDAAREAKRLTLAKARFRGHAERRSQTAKRHREAGIPDDYMEEYDPRQQLPALEIRATGHYVSILNTSHPDWRPKWHKIIVGAVPVEDETETQATPSTAEQQAS